MAGSLVSSSLRALRLSVSMGLHLKPLSSGSGCASGHPSHL